MRSPIHLAIVLGLALSGMTVTAAANRPQASSKTKSHRSHKPTGWQPGGPLTPLYRSAVAAIHGRRFEEAESDCERGLQLAPGDKAFLDLQKQIPQWKSDTHQAAVSAQYAKAVALVHADKLDDAEEACRVGLGMDAGNRSFEALLKDIQSRRNVAVQNGLLRSYQRATRLMNQHKFREAEAECKKGLRLNPDDVQLKALLKLIRQHRAAR